MFPFYFLKEITQPGPSFLFVRIVRVLYVLGYTDNGSDVYSRMHNTEGRVTTGGYT